MSEIQDSQGFGRPQHWIPTPKSHPSPTVDIEGSGGRIWVQLAGDSAGFRMERGNAARIVAVWWWWSVGWLQIFVPPKHMFLETSNPPQMVPTKLDLNIGGSFPGYLAAWKTGQHLQLWLMMSLWDTFRSFYLKDLNLKIQQVSCGEVLSGLLIIIIFPSKFQGWTKNHLSNKKKMANCDKSNPKTKLAIFKVLLTKKSHHNFVHFSANSCPVGQCRG